MITIITSAQDHTIHSEGVREKWIEPKHNT